MTDSEWKREREIRQEKIKKLDEEIAILMIQVEQVLKEKKQHDIEMNDYISRQSMDVQKQIDDYDIQIAKLLEAKSICQKSMITTRKMAAQVYKEKNPFTKHREVLGKLYRLRTKRSTL